MSKSKKQSRNELLVTVVVIGAVVAYLMTMFPDQSAEIAKITDVQGLNTAAQELDDTNVEELDMELNKLDQDASQF